jgi:hypothetical protein
MILSQIVVRDREEPTDWELVSLIPFAPLALVCTQYFPLARNYGHYQIIIDPRALRARVS